MNPNIQAAWEYHNLTKHSLSSLRLNQHSLDWSNQPRPYKEYTNLGPLPLPKDLPATNISALSAMSILEVDRTAEAIPDLRTLASLLHFSAGITKWLQSAGGRMAFRAAACTGALYHIELYVVCGDVPGLPAGVYHFGVHDGALRRLRSGDFRGTLVEATAEENSVLDAPVSVICTSTFWRNSWKYQSRTYRHSYWDNGTILANMLTVATAHHLPARVVMGFVDDQLNHLLGVDGQREAVISLVTLGHAPSMHPGSPGPVETLNLETTPLSKREIDYPSIRAIHNASSLSKPDEVSKWRMGASLDSAGVSMENLVPLRPIGPDEQPKDDIETVIKRRGSSRGFRHDPVSFESLSTAVDMATLGIPTDFLHDSSYALNDLYLIANSVEGLEGGAYVFHPLEPGLELLKPGSFREEAGHLDLGQDLAGDASVNVYFMTDLNPILERFGNRGYRIAQIEASIMAGKLYLGAYALGLGATGLTFFDDDVTTFFAPHAQDKSVMFLLAVGIPSQHQGV